MILFALALIGCKAEPTPPSVLVESDTDTDTDADADADTDADADSDSDADTDLTDTGSNCSEDLFEPNDTLDEALPLHTATGLWVRLGAPDLFRISLPPGTRLVTTATHSWTEGDVDLYVLNTDGLVIGSTGASVSDVERAAWCNDGVLDATVYVYAEIWEASLDPCNTYDLGVVLTEDACAPPDTSDTGSSNDTAHTGLVHTGTSVP